MARMAPGQQQSENEPILFPRIGSFFRFAGFWRRPQFVQNINLATMRSRKSSRPGGHTMVVPIPSTARRRRSWLATFQRRFRRLLKRN